MKTVLRIGIVVLSVLVSTAAFGQDKQSHPAPPPPPSNPVHAAPAPPPPPPPAHAAPPQAVHAAPAPQATRVSPPQTTVRSTPSAERAVPREGAMPRSAGRDPSLVDPAAASAGPSRGGARGAAPAAPSGTRAVPRTDATSRPVQVRDASRGSTTPDRAVPSGERSRGNRPSYGVATARQHPPHYPGGGGGYYPGYPWYAPWYPYSFGLFFWDPFWYSYPAYPVYDYGWYGGGGGGGSSSAYGYGSLKLKVKPSDAQVYVDGYFAGLVDDYDGMFQKLNLEVGAHHIEIRATGFQTLEFDVDIQLDQTVTYHGELMKAVR